MVLSGSDGVRAACALLPGAFSSSTDIKPASTFCITKRLAAEPNACRCARLQNRCAVPPERRGLNGRLHHRQRRRWACAGTR